MWTSLFRVIAILSLLQGLDVFGYNIKPASKEQSPSSDIPLKRNARVWTDENFACILRHCKQHTPGSGSYLSCLSENCRRGMMAVQRDIEYPYYGDYADDPSLITPDIMEASPASYLPTKVDHTQDFHVDYMSSCYNRHCQGLSIKSSLSCLVDHCIDEAGTRTNQVEQHKRFGQYPTSSSRFTKLNSLLEWMYSDQLDDEIDGADGGEIASATNNNNNKFNQVPAANVNKRRVNDEVSQCIQSYCANSVERWTCILKHCHRTRSIYKRKK